MDAAGIARLREHAGDLCQPYGLSGEFELGLLLDELLDESELGKREG